jgi:hypothetical protein
MKSERNESQSQSQSLWAELMKRDPGESRLAVVKDDVLVGVCVAIAVGSAITIIFWLMR